MRMWCQIPFCCQTWRAHAIVSWGWGVSALFIWRALHTKCHWVWEAKDNDFYNSFCWIQIQKIPIGILLASKFWIFLERRILKITYVPINSNGIWRTRYGDEFYIQYNELDIGKVITIGRLTHSDLTHSLCPFVLSHHVSEILIFVEH